MLNAAVRLAPYTASGTPLVSFSAGRLVRRLTHTLTYDGGVPLRSLAGLRVNTGTVACGRGSSPAPYSPPSAETVAGGGEGLTLHMCEGGNLQLTNLIHSPRKERGCFFSQQTFRGKTSLQSQTKMAAVWAVNFDPILPITRWLPAPNGRFRVRNLSNDIKLSITVAE